MNKLKKALLLTLALLLFSSPTLVQAATIKLNKTKSTIYTGATTQLKITGTKAKVKWKTSNKNIATVTQKGKVSAKKAGKATITATINGKGYDSIINVIKADYTENIKELKDYINKNGFIFKEERVIRWEDQYGDGRGEGIRLLTNGDLQLGSSNNGEGADRNKGYYGSIRLIFDINNMSNANIVFELDFGGFARGIETEFKVDITKLVRKNDIDFGLGDEKNKRTNDALNIALSRLNEFMLEEVNMGLNDIGFENYK